MPGVLSPTEHVLSARMSSKRAADAAPAAADDASTKRPRRDPDWSPGHQRMGMRTSQTSKTSETSRKRKQPADDVPANAAGASRATKQGRPAGWTPGCGLTYAQYRASQSEPSQEPSQEPAADDAAADDAAADDAAAAAPAAQRASDSEDDKPISVIRAARKAVRKTTNRCIRVFLGWLPHQSGLGTFGQV